MFTELKKISEFKDLADNGIVCLVDTNDKNEMRFAVYTNNFEILENLGIDTSELEDCMNCIESADQEPYFNILEKEIEYPQLHIFTGRAFNLASIDSPERENTEELLKLDAKDFVSATGYKADLINALEIDSQYNLLFQVNEPNDVVIAQVDEYGKDKSKAQVILNADSRFTEHEGYLFVAKKNEPVWLSKEKADNVNLKGKSALFPTIAYVNAEGNPVHIQLLASEE